VVVILKFETSIYRSKFAAEMLQKTERTLRRYHTRFAALEAWSGLSDLSDIPGPLNEGRLSAYK
jgi:hypothetical protein